MIGQVLLRGAAGTGALLPRGRPTAATWSGALRAGGARHPDRRRRLDASRGEAGVH